MMVPITVNYPATAQLVLEQNGQYLVASTTVGQPLQWSTPFDPAKHGIALTPDPQFSNLQRCQVLSDAFYAATAIHIYVNGAMEETSAIVGSPISGGIAIGRPR